MSNALTLVIWSNINEELKPDLIMLDDAAVAELGTTHEEMRSMEDVYINCCEDDAAEDRLTAIVYETESGTNRLNKWKMETVPLHITGSVAIVRCGFVN